MLSGFTEKEVGSFVFTLSLKNVLRQTPTGSGFTLNDKRD